MDAGIILIIFGIVVGLIVLVYSIQGTIETKKQEQEAIKKRIEKEENNQIEKYKQLNETLEQTLNYQKKCIQDFDKIIKEKCEYYPQLASIMSDLLTLYYERSANYLIIKKHPALTEAKRIKDLRADTRKILSEKKLLEYKLGYIYTLYPDIAQIFDSGYEITKDDMISNSEKAQTDSSDNVKNYLTNEEYEKLSTTERNQLALDRYVANRKSKWQVGRDYEMYVGYQYFLQGYNIEYSGILKRLEDMGRDLIASNNKEVLIIQCKNWSKEKTIHEKHIFQLYGTVVLYQLETLFPVRGIFVTSTKLSDKAKRIANYLHIDFIEEYSLGEFPRIKCNINRLTQEKIYHLPFDQQYDKTIIEIKKGEFYAMTVAEAENKGFRRALKHTNNI